MLKFQKFFLILPFCIAPIIAMENDKAIRQNGKPVFMPTVNIPKANAELLKIVNNKIKFQEKDWESIKKHLKNGANPNLKYGSFQTPLICLAVEYNKKDLFDYLLKLSADINAQDSRGWTSLHIFISLRPSNFDIGDLLTNRANTNKITTCGNTPISLAIEQRKCDFITSLIRYKANVNYKNADGIHPLKLAIDYANCGIIRQLCKAGACAINLDNYNHTAFHVVADELAVDKPEKAIKTLMAHIRFNNNNKIKNTLKTVLLVFNRLSHPLKPESQNNSIKFPVIPHEIQILILSKLLSPNFFHKELYKQCEGKSYQQLPLKLVNEHIQYLKHILHMKNSYNQTALELLPKEDSEAFVCGHRTYIERLLEGTELRKDLKIFNKAYPDIMSILPANLARRIFENHYIR